MKGNLVELVHDPLGLELVQTGKIRGETVRFDDWEQREVGSIAALKDNFSIQQFTFPAQKGDKNTLRIGVVVIRAEITEARVVRTIPRQKNVRQKNSRREWVWFVWSKLLFFLSYNRLNPAAPRGKSIQFSSQWSMKTAL